VKFVEALASCYLSILGVKFQTAPSPPLGMVEQGSINDSGRLIKKLLVTHDHSLTGPIGLSVNKLVVISSLTGCMFGFCLKRIIHYIFSLRQRHPTKHFLVRNFDFKSAYRRAHLSGQTSLEIITHVNGFLVDFLHIQDGL
jgi:hypothetical protein